MPTNIEWIVGPVHTGKTTRLSERIAKNPEHFCGILAPTDEKGNRYLQNIITGERCLLDCDVDQPEAVAVGPYTFSIDVFRWGNSVINEHHEKYPNRKLVIDEIGKLELRNSGLYPSCWSTLKERQHLNQQAIIIVRDSLEKQVQHRMTYSTFILETDRLILRPWSLDDLPSLEKLCSDPKVMEHFPSTLNRNETEDLLSRLIDSYEQRGHTYFYCARKDTSAFIGFIGLAYQDYDSPCTPAVDIGWRLLPSAWGNGFASEGAKACLNFGFEKLKLEEIVAICTKSNTASARVMERIGMTKGGTFKHPKLNAHPELQTCLWYSISKK